MKKLRWIVLLAAVGLPRMGWSVDACEQDRPKVCGGVTPGPGAVHSCMLAKLSKLSPDCQDTVKKSEALLKEFLDGCQSDARRFCAMKMDLDPNQVVDCVMRHMDKFSPECKRIYAQLKAYEYPVLK